MSVLVDGQWLPTPLVRYTGETLIRNPANGATYANAVAANAAVGENIIEVVQNPNGTLDDRGDPYADPQDPDGPGGGGEVTAEVDDPDGPLTAYVDPVTGEVVISHNPVQTTVAEGAGFFDSILDTVDDVVVQIADSIGVEKKLVYVGGAVVIGYFVFGQSLFGSGGRK